VSAAETEAQMWSRLRQTVKFQPLVVLALSAICSFAVAQEPAAPPSREPSAAQMPMPLEDQLADFRHLRRANANPRTCVARLHAIGSLGTDQAVEALIKLVPKLEGVLQMAAVHAIYLANSNYANEQLHVLTGRRRADVVRRQASRDLMLAGGEHFAFLRDQRLTREKNLMIRGEILHGLIENHVANLESEILKAAKSKDSVYASAGIFGVGQLRIKPGYKYVRAAAQGEDLQLRRDGFHALGAIGGPQSFELLLKAYGQDHNMMLREEIALQLQRASELGEIQTMLDFGLTSAQPGLVRVAVEIIALAAPNFPELCHPPLFKLLDHEDSLIRGFALEGLVLANSQDVTDLLLTRLQSADAHTCSEALWALNTLKAVPQSSEMRIAGLAEHLNQDVRMQAAAALRWFPLSGSAFDVLLERLQDPSWVVRSMAAESLRFFRRKESLPGLIQLLQTERGRVFEDALASLTQLTGHDFSPQPAVGWKQFLETQYLHYELPTAEQVNATLVARAQANASDTHTIAGTTYHGLQIPPGDVVFLFDVSGSMSNRFDRDRSYYEHFSTTLNDTLANLLPQTNFNVVVFASDVRVWKSALASASADNITSAQSFLSKTSPGGGTNLHSALIAGMTSETVQNIFLLTDGEPTLGAVIAHDAIKRDFERRNRYRRIRLHTIAAGSAGASFLADLAAASGGKAVDLTGVGR
jgi:HEAT repeat protein